MPPIDLHGMPLFNSTLTQPGGPLYHERGQQVPLGTSPERSVPLLLLDRWYVIRPFATGSYADPIPWQSPPVLDRPFLVDATANGPFNTDEGLRPRLIVRSGRSPRPLEELQLIGHAYPVPVMDQVNWRDAFFHLTALRRQAIVDDGDHSTLELIVPGFEAATRCVETAGRYYNLQWQTAISSIFEYFLDAAIVLHNPAPSIQTDFERWIRSQTPRLGIDHAEYVPYTYSAALIAPVGYVWPLLAEFLHIREAQGRSDEPMSLEELQMYAASIMVSLRGGPVTIYLGDILGTDDSEVDDRWWEADSEGDDQDEAI
ncbi:hypothetical protein CALVIDRAFT_562210 [Calocera viscosa TUFC12733]|uniref:Uncharacterized protein n=1 Tax=Calocera viscosa (strain TUFC12733) TaxID=1330018 RepID=A0A167P0G7_CALVF|nr:hypothetical protein CALVIDRAFT_562210 [Calocera viscosa TUFC12733]